MAAHMAASAGSGRRPSPAGASHLHPAPSRMECPHAVAHPLNTSGPCDTQAGPRLSSRAEPFGGSAARTASPVACRKALYDSNSSCDWEEPWRWRLT
jgi:hypothetical protein